jgi:hypothetical protein
MGTRFFPGGKADGSGGDVKYSPLSSAEVKNEWRYTATPLIRLHGVGMNFTILPLFLFGSLILLIVVTVKLGIFWRKKNIFNASCQSRKLSRRVTFSQNFITLEL